MGQVKKQFTPHGEDISSVFARAAADVHSSTDFYAEVEVSVCMCDALFHAADMRPSIYKPAQRLLMEHIGIDAIAAGPEDYRWGKNFGDTADEIRECRVLALCFMAAMTEKS